MTQCRYLYNDQSIENVKSKNEDFDNAKKHLAEQASKALYGVRKISRSKFIRVIIFMN